MVHILLKLQNSLPNFKRFCHQIIRKNIDLDSYVQHMHGSTSVSNTSASLQKNMKLPIRLQHQQSGEGFVQSRHMHLDATRFPFKSYKNSPLWTLIVMMYISPESFLENLSCIHGVFYVPLLRDAVLQGNPIPPAGTNDVQSFEEDRHTLPSRIKKICTENWPLIVAISPKLNLTMNTRERCLQDGTHVVIRKPVILQEMVDELQSIIQCTQASSLPLW